MVAPASRRIRTSQSRLDAEYSASRQRAITSYQGRWKAVKKSQARLSARAGVTAGRPGTRSGMRSSASSATAPNSRYATSARCGGTLDTLNRVYPRTGRQNSWYMVSQVIPGLRVRRILIAGGPAAR